ncbi:MAG: hypothetical protein M3R15_23565, partial [Acidobacteriota bacterium]|nr:hypothetical protein [Acidobacteriota bacterium]
SHVRQRFPFKLRPPLLTFLVPLLDAKHTHLSGKTPLVARVITFGANCFAEVLALFGSLMLRFQYCFSAKIAGSGRPAPKSAVQHA